jgi:hypothetical protein
MVVLTGTWLCGVCTRPGIQAPGHLGTGHLGTQALRRGLEDCMFFAEGLIQL